MTPRTDANPAGVEAAFQSMRRPANPNDMTLSSEAKALYGSLPQKIRPEKLATRYPRILNEIARLWKRSPHLEHYLDDLLTDKRGNRQGFAFGIVMELAGLKEHHDRVLHPAPNSVWELTVLEHPR